ncbi:MAG: diguanylate cyclase [Planctomycetes bacterium]|nr:diguanylate cyclase [Planctomycetota bacterium]
MHGRLDPRCGRTLLRTRRPDLQRGWSPAMSEQTSIDRVVLISESADLRSALARACGDGRVEIEVLPSCIQAVRRLRESPAAWVVASFEELGEKAAEIIPVLREVSGGAEVFLAANAANAERAEVAVRHGVSVWLAEPSDHGDIASALESAFKRRRDLAEVRAVRETLRVREEELSISRAQTDALLLECERLHKSIADLEGLQKLVMDVFLRQSQAERGSLMLLDEQRQELAICSATGLAEDVMRQTRVKLGEAIAGRVASEGRPLLVRDVRTELPGHTNRIAAYKTPSFVSLPLKVEERVIGVVNVTDRSAGRTFGESDLSTLSTLANQAAIAIEDAQLLDRARRLSVTDELTGLYNRRYFLDCLGCEIERSARHSHQFAVAILDIDHFKLYNDRYGHPAGDAILRELARLLRQNLRHADVVARYGGEEFAILYPEVDRVTRIAYLPNSAGFHFTERLRLAIVNHRFQSGLAGRDGRLTISGGVALFPYDGKAGGDLIRRADENLYRAKASGRNRIYSSTSHRQ